MFILYFLLKMFTENIELFVGIFITITLFCFLFRKQIIKLMNDIMKKIVRYLVKMFINSTMGNEVKKGAIEETIANIFSQVAKGSNTVDNKPKQTLEIFPDKGYAKINFLIGTAEGHFLLPFSKENRSKNRLTKIYGQNEDGTKTTIKHFPGISFDLTPKTLGFEKLIIMKSGSLIEELTGDSISKSLSF